MSKAIVSEGIIVGTCRPRLRAKPSRCRVPLKTSTAGEGRRWKHYRLLRRLGKLEQAA